MGVTGRWRRGFRRGLPLVIILGVVLGLGGGRVSGQEEPADQTAQAGPEDLADGEAIYVRRCVFCHGAEGQGDGPAADFLTPRPRDFTRGLYKLRSTPSGEPPTDADLFRTVTNGIPGTGMPDWGDLLTEQERRQVVQFIKPFSERFQRLKEPTEPIEVGSPIPSTPESIEQGRALFLGKARSTTGKAFLPCLMCHGPSGRGNGPLAPSLKDSHGFPIRPRNLTKGWTFRGGHRPQDIFLRIRTGLAGTPMPSFANTLSPEETWHLVNFIRSLGSEQRRPLKVAIRVKKIEDELPDTLEDSRWEQAEQYDFPLVGQVIREPRQFTPSVDTISVKALYNDRELALWLAWDDPTHDPPNPAAGVYEDAMAVQFPVEIPKGARRPFFLMGDPIKPVNLWRWDSASQELTEINGNGLDTLVPQSAESQETRAFWAYKDGRYSIVIKRLITTANKAQDIQFEPGRFIPIAFFVWDGSHGETATKMAISHWYFLLLEPPIPRTVYIYPPMAILVAVGLEWWTVRRIRRGTLDVA